MEFKLKDVLDAVGPTASLIFAAWIYLSFLQQRYSSGYQNYRDLVSMYRDGRWTWACLAWTATRPLAGCAPATPTVPSGWSPSGDGGRTSISNGRARRLGGKRFIDDRQIDDAGASAAGLVAARLDAPAGHLHQPPRER
jgi:hypothetical protein